MRYLIDGYNLAHALGLLLGRVSPAELDRARQALLDRLTQAHGPEAAEVTVVFDSHSARRREQQVIAGIDIRFAAGEEADDVIERLIKGHPHPKRLTVVSDDRRLQSAAKRRGCEALGCQAYLDRLEKPVAAAPLPPPEKPEPPGPDEAAEWERRFADAKSARLPRRHGRRI